MNVKSVAIVDDNSTDRYIAKRIIKKVVGDEVRIEEFEAAEEFVEALSSAESFQNIFGVTPPPVFVLLDINMPRMSGFELLDQISNRNHSMVLAMYSSSDHREDLNRARGEELVQEYITKPITRQKVKEIFDFHYKEN